MAFQQYNVYEGLTAVRVVDTANLAGTYFNGQTNNGVGATLTVTATGALTIDSVVVVTGDSVLLMAQTNTNENGIYIVSNPGATGIQPILTRRADQQNIEQIRAGQYVSVAAGAVNAGNFYTIVEPLPAHFGIDAIVFNADPSAGGVSFSGGPSTANALAVYADAAGNLKPQTTTSTLGFGLTAATGNFTATAGNVIAGSSGAAGNVQSFPAVAASGELILSAVTNATGNFKTTISNAAAVAQNQIVTIPDGGAATAEFVLAQSAIPTNNVAFTIVKTAGFAALAAAGKVNLVVHPSATAQFAILDIKVLKSTGLSGGGGDRLLAVSDGTIVFNNAGITAALLGTPILTLWGGAGNPLAVGASEVSTAGADIFLQYTGGTTDFTAGSVQVAVTMVQVTA